MNGQEYSDEIGGEILNVDKQKHAHNGVDHTHLEGGHTHANEAHAHNDETHTHDGSTHTHGEVTHTHGGVTHTHNAVTHTHDGSTHTHTHSHTHTKAVVNRLSRAIGHLTAVRSMVEDGRDCAEVLIQLSAVRSAINGACEVILTDHLNHCIVDAVETGDMESIEALNQAIKLLMK
jgi:DNA-binding FrmR family transcriptional regulator